jgi:uncharacterized protein (TIGR03083 family)
MIDVVRVDEHVAVLRRDGDELADAAHRAGLAAAVPTCSGWLVRDLLHHLGGVHRWAAHIVASGRAAPPSAEEEARFFTGPDDDTLVDWFRAGHRDLVSVLSAADPAVACWAFLPAPSPLAFWARRQAHETAIHRADAESALGATPAWHPGFAVDGVDELLNGFLARRPDRTTADPPVSMSLAATDIDTAWTIRLDAAGLHVHAGERSAELAVSGPATDLYLLLWNRADLASAGDRLTVRGDPRALTVWRDTVAVRWS